MTSPAEQKQHPDENDGTACSNTVGYGSIDSGDKPLSPPTSSSSSSSSSSSEIWENDGPAKKEQQLTYTDLLKSNPNFRYFLMSYLINKMGEWLTYLASISLIQEVSMRDGTSQNTNTLISILILVKILPNVLLMPFGGVLADSYDRRKIQITLDLCSSSVVLIFLWSYASQSIFLCLVANFLIETSSGLYIPSNQAMLPQLFGKGNNKSKSEEGDAELTKATVLYGMSWSLMAALGSSLGGVLVAAFGIKGCFIIDSITYLISAIILRFLVQGNFNASSVKESLNSNMGTDDLTSTKSPSSSFSSASENLSLLEEQIKKEESHNETKVDEKDLDSGGMELFVSGLQFLFIEEPLVGACALLKGSAALAYGAMDVLNVSFSARGSEMDPSQTSLKLGILFGCVGVGCILGSMITDAISDLSFPQRITRLSLGGFFCTFVALFWMAATPEIFASLCASTVTRSIGSSIVWINSTLLIQKFTPQRLLGRVSSFDTGVALFAEAISALGAGMLMDERGISAEGLSLILGCIALWFFFFWSPLAFRF